MDLTHDDVVTILRLIDAPLERGEIPLELELEAQGTLAERIRAGGAGLGGVLTPGLRISNDEVAELVGRSGGRLIGFGSVDPWKGRAAVQEVERCRALGMKGMKFQPITQAFFPDDPRFAPIWAACQALGLIVLFHAGTTAIGNGAPGGRGLHLKYGRPIPALDDVAAGFPDLTIIAAHPGWPWHLELLAVARHKGNVYIDLSGWDRVYTDYGVFTPQGPAFVPLELAPGVDLKGLPDFGWAAVPPAPPPPV